jgi:hypothetical protein
MTIKRLFKTLEKCLPPFDTFFWISSSLFIPSGSRKGRGHLSQQRRTGRVPSK